ncbi:MAG: DMT family transporter [Bdellovibrionales bacterium]
MFNNLTSTQKGIALALIGYSGFAISDASAKFLTGHYDIFVIIAYIMLIASGFLLAAAPFLGGITRPAKGALRYHALRTVMNFLVSVFIVYAFAQLPLATIYAIIFAKPFLAALLAIPLYRERVTAARWAAIAVGFCGVLIAMRPGASGIDPALLLPLAAAICAAVMWVSTRSLQGESIFNMAFYPIAGTFILSLLVSLSDFQIPAIGHLVFFIICGAGVSTGCIGLSLAFSTAPSAAVSPFHYTQMVWGLVFGVLVFGDYPDLYTIIGAAVIIASGLFLIYRERSFSQ